VGVLKSPFRACVRRAFRRYHYLRAFSGVDIRAPGIKSDWCIYSIRAVYGFFSRLRAIKLRLLLGPFPQSHPRWARKLWARLEKYIGWNVSA